MMQRICSVTLRSGSTKRYVPRKWTTFTSASSQSMFYHISLGRHTTLAVSLSSPSCSWSMSLACLGTLSVNLPNPSKISPNKALNLHKVMPCMPVTLTSEFHLAIFLVGLLIWVEASLCQGHVKVVLDALNRRSRRFCLFWQGQFGVESLLCRMGSWKGGLGFVCQMDRLQGLCGRKVSSKGRSEWHVESR